MISSLSGRTYLSKKKGKEVYLNPEIDGDKIIWRVVHGNDCKHEGTVNRNGAKCIFCGSDVKLDHIRREGKAGRLSAEMIAIVAKGNSGRVYLPPNSEHIAAANVDKPEDFPSGDLPDKALGFRVQEYGITEWHQLFTNRQLTALTTFSDLIPEIQDQVQADGGSKDYADAIAVYMAFLIDQLANHTSTICGWNAPDEQMRSTFSLQAIPMVWNFAECNIFSKSTGSYENLHNWEVYEISCNDENNIQKAAEKFCNEELLIRSWGAIHLRQKLSELIWKHSDSTDFKRLWEIFTTYLYMPRLNESKVLKSTIIKGIQAKDFAVAETFDGEKYQNLKFEGTVTEILPSTLIVNPTVAQKQINSEKIPLPNIVKTSNDGQRSTPSVTSTLKSSDGGKAPPEKILSKSFSMEVELNPFRINKEISDLMNNILNRLINLSSSQISLKLEVDIKNENGIPKEEEDTVSENCHTLKIKTFYFEN